MNINVLKTFCDLVDTGSFSRAATANFISQSAVSQQLAKLEESLSIRLISRGGGVVEPTEAGRALYQGARDILRRYEQLLGEVRSASDAIRGVLRVGTIYSVGFYLLDPYVRRFLREHPEVHLHVDYTGWKEIYTAISGGAMDFGVVACPEPDRSLEMIPLASEEMLAVFPPNHRLAKRRQIDPTDLAGEPCVAFEKDIPTRRLVDRLLKPLNVSLDVSLEFDNVELLKRAIMVGSGVSILPARTVAAEVERGDLASARFRDHETWQRPLAILRRHNRSPSPAEEMFLSILRDEA